MLAVSVLLVPGVVLVLIDRPMSPLIPLCAAGIVVVAAVAGLVVPRLNRHAGDVLAVSVLVLLAAGCVLVAALAAVLVAGRLPRAAERNVVPPAMIGGVVGAALLALLLPGARAGLALVVRRQQRPEQVVRTFAERSSRGTSQDDLLALADSLRRTMGVHAAEIWRVEADVLSRVASSPQRGLDEVPATAIQRDSLARADIAGPAWLRLWLPELGAGRPAGDLRAVAAAHFGQLLGVVVVEKGEGQGFSPAEDRALIDLGHRLGTVLGNLELDSALRATLADLQRVNEDLQASRGRLVETADAERRRIERDLHDGAQQQLVALAINLSLAKSQLAAAPQAADAVLDDLASQVRDTIDEVRELAHGIYPPALAHGGLEDALRTAVARGPVPVTLQAGAVSRYLPSTEAAVYFCCLEALQNSAKHAGGAQVEITLADEGQRLSFLIRDHGPGYDPGTVTHGHGLENMNDRVGALGGRVTWESAPQQGVSVAGWVPARRVPS